MTEPVMIVSRVRTAWGFSIRYAGLSAAQPALPLPPPTTVIGFYAEPLARLLGLPEYLAKSKYCSPAELLANYTLAAAAGLEPGSPAGIALHSDVTRVLSLVYQRKRAKWEPYAWSVQALGASYAPSTRLVLGIVIDAEGLGKELGIGIDSLEDLLKKVAWSGWRLGSKEGLAIVEEAKISKAEEAKGDAAFESVFYQDSETTVPLDPENIVKVHMWRHRPTKLFCGEQVASPAEFLVPVSPVSTPSFLVPPEDPIRFRLREGARAYCLKGSQNLCIATSKEA
ncbi:hypothetical protein PYJP_06180 [Pyrofollis japonicus]|uniref:type I-E CRISPR-associated protein Cas5/CasD n=1 Tax=Pyrofollis japonicus TaxID=3060460 RepID=UPI00295B748A|nr:type I-E CRISPR-associated protein Cas5/CasD [Pyrofollis japonicus]BEP17266.1 hypothetical protein PYJP_06180 [Pyrofollis japonicus]